VGASGVHLYTLVRCVENKSTVTAAITGIAVLQCRFFGKEKCQDMLHIPKLHFNLQFWNS
jgi:hypothetical protein